MLECKKIKKGVAINYVCGTEEKQIPEEVDLNLLTKVVMVALFMIVGTSMSMSRR